MSEAPWWRHVRGDPGAFLLDDSEPGVLRRVLVDLLNRPEDSPAVERARLASHERGGAAAILARQHPLGYWDSPGAYGARWGGSAWHLIALAQLGADGEDERVGRAVEALLAHIHPSSGGFAAGRGRPPSACFTAELAAALARLGFSRHPRVREAVAWLAAREEASGGWSCPELRHLVAGSCPVAAVAALRLVADHPPHERGQIAFLAGRGAAWLMARGLFLTGSRPKGWFEFGHPCLGRIDLLEALACLALLSWPAGDWTGPAVATVIASQDEGGTWRQRRRQPYGEAVDAPSRWLTLKALLVVAAYGDAAWKEVSA